MAATVIALTSAKGGTGKSTISLHLAGALIRRGHRVLLVDADPQGSLVDWAKGRCQDTPTVLAVSEVVEPKDIRRAGKKYDFVILDAPPTFKRRMKAVMRAADYLIIPVTPGMADLWSTRELAEVFLAEQEDRPRLDARLVINRMDTRTRLGKEFRGLVEQLSLPVFLTEIPQRAVYGEAWRLGKTVDRIRHGGPAAREMSGLAAEVERWIANTTEPVQPVVEDAETPPAG